MLIEQLAPSPSQQPDRPHHGLVSLREMIRLHLQNYVTLGRNIEKCRIFIQGAVAAEHKGRILQPMEAVAATLMQLRDACKTLELTTSVATIDKTVQSLANYAQIEVLVDVVESEMEGKLYLRVPSERQRYFQNSTLVSDRVAAAFPVSAIEISQAATAYACGLWSASVFHSMRSAEVALEEIANEFGIQTTGSEQWGKLIDQIEASLRDLAKKPKTDPQKIAKLAPLSEIATDLRLFKDAWRNQNSHNVVAYNDSKALDIIEAVCRVLEAAALRVKP